MKLMTILCSGLLCIVLVSCGTDKGSSERSTVELNQEVISDGERMLVGEVDVNGFKLPEYRHWFDSTYQAYSLDKDVIGKLEPVMEDVTMRVYLSTWCSDTRRDVPALMRILDELDFDFKSVKMIALDRNMESPGSEQEGFDIGFVPTTIFYRGDTELGRIIEYPNTTLEEDMLTILSK